MDLDQFGELVIKQIHDKGYKVTLLAPGTSLYRTNSSVGLSVRKVKALFVDYHSSEIDSEIIRHGDKHCLIEGKVDLSYQILYGEHRYSIVTVREVKPYKEAVYSRVQLRLDQ